ncbi:SAM-dependent methyltransferase [Ornithinibacillus xuwenensis]|uniref:Class I SAM-dependent methyltransferase n=1 Tax=Ornithinibacillus xuwenensis TaxID=3144668 RepID=A0ABU9XJF7_9BACI
MKWVQSFYEKQYKLIHHDGNIQISENHVKLLKKMESMVNKDFSSILELGAGMGEFAITAAKNGYHVTAIEIISSAAKHIREMASQLSIDGRLQVITDDFYHVPISQSFDVVCYLDGFGIGGDQDQRELLRKIHDWLQPSGCAIIDIYTPWYWLSTNGQEMSFSNFKRKYGFDANSCRMLDTWYDLKEPSEIYTQSLRCYSPEDLRLLLNGTGLVLTEIYPGGALDYANWQYYEEVSLIKAMSYTAILKKE